jgi:hypothetical protein
MDRNDLEAVGALVLFAIAIIPLSIWYYFLLGRHFAPRLVALPILLAITIFAFAAALPWIIFASVVWIVQR